MPFTSRRADDHHQPGTKRRRRVEMSKIEESEVIDAQLDRNVLKERLQQGRSIGGDFWQLLSLGDRVGL
jgi:hypothetical protein